MTTRTRRTLLAIDGGEPAVPLGSHKPWPQITEADRAAVAAVLLRGELWGLHGPEVTALQREYADYCGARHCLAVNSGTAALHCALVASGVQPGAEVIVPAFSFVASAMAVLQADAVPVFCDIDPETYNINARQVEALITDATAAIMAVHIHGVVADMSALASIAEAHGLPLIEDAAQAHGSIYQGRKAGSLGFCGAFSLNGAKNLNAGEGGLFVCDDDDAYRAARRLAIFGEDTPRPNPGEDRAFWSHGIGWNYRIHEITATLARSQLTRLDEYNYRARRNAAVLTAGLQGIPGFTPQHVPQGTQSVYCRYRFRFDPETFGWDGPPTEFRDRLLFALRAEGLAVDAWQLRPLPAQPVFRHGGVYYAWTPSTHEPPLTPWDPATFPQASRLLDQSLALCPDRQALYVQDESLMHLYVDAFEKVRDHMDHVLTAPYDPHRTAPSIPSAEL